MRRLWRYFTGLYQWILSLTGLKTDISNLIITVSSHFYSPTVRLKKRKEIFDWVQVVKGNHRVPRTPSSFSDAWKRRNPWTVNGRRVLHAHATPPMTRSAAGRDHRDIYFFLSLSLSLSLSLFILSFSHVAPTHLFPPTKIPGVESDSNGHFLFHPAILSVVFLNKKSTLKIHYILRMPRRFGQSILFRAGILSRLEIDFFFHWTKNASFSPPLNLCMNDKKMWIQWLHIVLAFIKARIRFL